MASSNVLIVESSNDKHFVEAMKSHLNNMALEVDIPINTIDDYECLDGISQDSLEKKLRELVIKIEKQGIDKVGILLDADLEGVDAKIDLINRALKTVQIDLEITGPNEWFHCASLDIQISCHILNLNGGGELETLLRHVKSHDSVFADCLTAWRGCLEENGQGITDKNFDKFWISIYQRYDCCTSQEQRQAGRKCNMQASLLKDIWDFDHVSLEQFRSFIQMFSNT